MPAVGDTGKPLHVLRRRRPKPPTVRPAPSFARPIGGAPFAAAQQRAAARTRRAERRLTRAPIAAPPVIRNPTPAQTHAAARQIAQSITRAVGPHGSARDRIARRDTLIAEIHANPRYARQRASLKHWTREQARITRPDPRDRVAPGRRPTLLHAGIGPSVNLTALGRSLATLTPQGLRSGSPGAQIVRNALGDVRAIGEAPFVGGYAIGSAVVGDVAETLRTGHSTLRREGDIGRGLLKGIKEEVTHPGKALRQHPLLTALDVTGAGSIVGRSAGAVARGLGTVPEAAGVRGALARAGSTARPPIALTEDPAGGLVERRYSRDLIRKAIQQGGDATRDPVRDIAGRPVTVRQGRRDVPVLRPRSELERTRLANRRADMIAARENAAQRLARDQAGHELRVRRVRGRAGRQIVRWAAEGVITSAQHMPDDLRGYVKRVRANLAQHETEVRAGQDPSIYRHEGEVRRARENVRLAERVLNNPRALAQAGRIVTEGERHGAASVAGDVEAARIGLGDAEQLRRARLVHPAVEHMGATHGRDPRITARRAALARNQRSLQARLNFGHVPAAERARVAQQIESTRQTRQALAAQNTERLRDPQGRPLEPQQIESFLRSRGRDPGTVGFMPGEVKRGMFYQQFRPGQRGTLDTGARRTGTQHLKGATETSAQVLRAQGVRQRTQIVKAQHIDRLVGEHGMRHPKGRYFTGKEAAEIIDRAAGRGETLVAVRAFPAKLDTDTQRIIRDDLQGPGAADTLAQRLLNSRILTSDELAKGAKNVVLMNKALVDRLARHLAPASPVNRMFQVLNQAFRYAVLPQFRWLAGNFVEPYIVRLTAAGSGLNVFGLAVDIRASRRILKAMRRGGPREREAAQAIQAQQLGGLFIGRRGASNRRTLEDFPALEQTAQRTYSRMVSKLPIVRHIGDLTGTLLKGGANALLAPARAFFLLNRAIESGAQHAALGRSARREMQEFTGSWIQTVRLGDQATREAAAGLVNTPTQHRFMQAQHELLGKYEGYSPVLRGLIQGPAPFLPWALSAARFALWTMPAHHTALTALLVRTNDVVAKDWKDLHAPVKGLKGGLQLAIPNGKGGWIDIARYTPWGLTGPIAEGDLQGLTDQFFPQLRGVVAAVEGKDPFGRDLQVSGGGEASTGQRIQAAGNQAAEATIPYLSIARRLREGGRTAYSDSTVIRPRTKPGTSRGMTALERTLSPIRPTYLGGATAPASGPVSPQDRLLEEAAHRSATGGLSAHQLELLERAARRAAGG
jgi:hypothetical protein